MHDTKEAGDSIIPLSFFLIGMFPRKTLLFMTNVA